MYRPVGSLCHPRHRRSQRNSAPISRIADDHAIAGQAAAQKLVGCPPEIEAETTVIELAEALNASGISLVFAELKDPVRAKIERYGLTRTIDPRHFFPTIESAVAAFREETGADWPAARAADREPT